MERIRDSQVIATGGGRCGHWGGEGLKRGARVSFNGWPVCQQEWPERGRTRHSGLGAGLTVNPVTSWGKSVGT